MHSKVLSISVACLCSVASAAPPGTWPQLLGDRSAHCNAAFEVGANHFASDLPYLKSPPAVPPGFGSAPVLGTCLVDSSGQDRWFAEEGTFETLVQARGGTESRVYWEKVPKYRRRLVVVQEPMGWRGERYFVFSVDREVTPAEVVSRLDAPTSSGEVIALLWGVWTPPLVFSDRTSGEIWLINLDAPDAGAQSSWSVYTSEPDGIRRTCSVQFGPSAQRHTQLLPPDVRRLARLLDQSIGSGEDEGTLQPTARLRTVAANTWLNAVLRPWAVSDAYNTRTEVDAGLIAWSKKNRRTYAEILRLYPIAERSLSLYYEREFGLTPKDATTLSSYVLDVAFRSNFKFHTDDPERLSRSTDSTSNPWHTLRH